MQERTASEHAEGRSTPADQTTRPPAATPSSPRTPSTSPRRSRSRLSFFAPRAASAVDPLLAPLLETMTAVSPKENQELVRRAYAVAERSHRGQTRRSGDPYITHPVSVATILAELGSPADVVAAALLHDTVEDTDYSLDQLRSEFGEIIAVMVDGVTKLDKVTYGEAAQAETVQIGRAHV